MMENNYRSLIADRIFDISQDLICVASMDGYFKYVNSAWEKVLGYSEDELLARPFLEFIHPDDHQRNKAEVANLSQGKLTEEYENRYIHKDGSVRYLSWKATPVQEENAAYCIGRDITEKKRIQQKLEQTLLEVETRVEARTRELADANRNLESLWNLSSLLDTNFKEICKTILREIVSMSLSSYGFYGFVNDSEDLLTINSWSEKAMKDCAIRNNPITLSITDSGVWGNAVRTRKPFLLNNYDDSCENKKGIPPGHAPLTRILSVPVIISGKVVAVGAVANKPTDYTDTDIQQLKSFLTSAHIIIDRKRSETNLLESEARYKAISEDMPLLICRFLPDYTITYVNDAYCSLSGKSSAELLGTSVLDCIPEFEKQHLISVLSESTYASPVQAHEHRVIASNKKTSWRRWMYHALYNEKKEIYAFQAIGEDISQRKKAEKTLQETLRFNELVLDTSPAGILIFREDGPCVLANPTAATIIGASVEQLLTLNYREMETYRKNGILADMEEALATGTVMKREVHTINTFGEEVWFEGVVSAFESAGKKHILYYFNDIIERKRAEAEKARLKSQLHQAMKMQAVGTLAGGIAHEFNNMLAIIMMGAELACDEVDAHSFVRTQLDTILKTSHRLKDLVRQILLFSRQDQQKKTALDIRPVIKETLKLLRSSLPSSVEIKEKIDITNGTVYIDPTEVQQIMMNLVSNAVWAMSEKGTIELHLCQLEIDDMEAAGLGITGGDYIKLSIRDNGKGMDSETRARIFDPFFTKKEVGEGRGMGLSIVYAIMESYDGAISVESEVGTGTTFNLFFHRTEEQRVETNIQREEISGGSERILFVDDEEDYAKLGAELLKRLGYSVDMRVNSIDALDAFRSAPDSYDLVITDQVMANLSGEELVNEIRSIRADIPVILCTGYSHQIDEAKAAALGIDEFVYKPLLKKDIARLIRRIYKPSR